MRRRKRLVQSPNFGPFFSTDAGGRPSSHMRGVGQSDGVPSGVNMPGMEDFLQTIQGAGIQVAGVFTPWGKLVQAPTEFGWGVAPLAAKPDTNTVAVEFTEVAGLLESLGFSEPAFLALMAQEPIPPEAVSRELEGSPYELFGDGLVVYSQSDTAGVPKMLFLYWIGLREPGDEGGGSLSVASAAEAVGATLMFAQQLPAETTTERDPPEAAANEAAVEQFPTRFPKKEWSGAPEPAPSSPPEETEPEPEPEVAEAGVGGGASMTGPILVGLGASVLGIALGRSLGGRRRR